VVTDDLTNWNDWYDWRQGGIGGSDIAALLGLSKWSSPTRLYHEKIGDLEASEATPRQRVGKRMESVLAAEFHDMTGLYVVSEQDMCEDVRPNGHRRCTIDGKVVESPVSNPALDSLGVVEFKTAYERGWPDGVPDHYRAQVVWQMGVTSSAHAWVCVMFSTFRVEVFPIAWDGDTESDWRYMCDVADRFWNDHVLPRVPPEVDASDATANTLAEMMVPLRDRWEAPAGHPLVDAVEVWRAAKRLQTAAETDVKQAANRIKDQLVQLDTEDVIVSGRPLVSWREQTRRGIDTARLKADHPELAGEYETVSTFRVLREPTEKGK
jgi:putative phage-type endonuclease